MLLVSDRDLAKPTGESVHVRNLVREFDRHPDVALNLVGPHPDTPVHSSQKAGRFKKIKRLLHTYIHAVRYSITSDFDLIYVRISPPLLPLFPLLRILNRKSVILAEANGILELEAKEIHSIGPLWKMLIGAQKLALKSPDAVVAVAEPIAKHIEESVGAQTFVVENGTDTDRFVPTTIADKRFLVQPKKIQKQSVGFVGHITEWQGVDKLLQAIELLAPEIPALSLTVVGGGPALPELEQLASDLSISHRVQFVGAVPYEEVPGWIQTFDLGITPARIESESGRARDSLKNYDYLATGTPIIVGADQSVKELLVDYKAGYTFKTDDPSELASLIRRYYLQSKTERAQMSQRARKLAVDHRSWKITVEKIVDVYRSLAGDKIE